MIPPRQMKFENESQYSGDRFHLSSFHLVVPLISPQVKELGQSVMAWCCCRWANSSVQTWPTRSLSWRSLLNRTNSPRWKYLSCSKNLSSTVLDFPSSQILELLPKLSALCCGYFFSLNLYLKERNLGFVSTDRLKVRQLLVGSKWVFCGLSSNVTAEFSLHITAPVSVRAQVGLCLQGHILELQTDIWDWTPPQHAGTLLGFSWKCPWIKENFRSAHQRQHFCGYAEIHLFFILLILICISALSKFFTFCETLWLLFDGTLANPCNLLVWSSSCSMCCSAVQIHCHKCPCLCLTISLWCCYTCIYHELTEKYHIWIFCVHILLSDVSFRMLFCSVHQLLMLNYSSLYINFMCAIEE